MNDPHENATWVYNYDRGGNILSKVKYAYTTGTVGMAIETIPYAYGDTNWKDKLTSYNGKTITYDAIGNPLNDGIWTYEWQGGRQLKRISSEGTAVSFKYDHNGMRTQKVVEASWYPETTNYTLNGKLVTHMTVDYTDFDEVAHQDIMLAFFIAFPRIQNMSLFQVENSLPKTVGLIPRIIRLIGILFLAFIAAFSVDHEIDMYNTSIGAYKRGEYKIVEGYVENFIPMPHEGHARESFEVNGVHFEYSQNLFSAGYSQTKSYGGVIRGNGQYLKIGYIYYRKGYGNIILYIEELHPSEE